MHHVEKCERDPAGAYAINALGPRRLAIEAERIGALLIHVSTDYVFDGGKNSPYVESDAPTPLNVYGNTKLAGEYYVRTSMKRHCVVRTSALYGQSPCRGKGGLNFVQLMLKLARECHEVRVVDSEFVSPTWTAALAAQIAALSRAGVYGLFHATSEESCSWHDFAKEIFSLTGTEVRLKAAAADEFPVKVARPSYSVLENRELKKAGINVFRPWREHLLEYLRGTDDRGMRFQAVLSGGRTLELEHP
jgi:dTDP-4-dehydrorhamnose reductase